MESLNGEILSVAREKYILYLTREGEIDRNCKTCQEEFYPQLEAGKRIFEIFAPRHKASGHCQSGKHPHCSCDTCF